MLRLHSFQITYGLYFSLFNKMIPPENHAIQSAILYSIHCRSTKCNFTIFPLLVELRNVHSLLAQISKVCHDLICYHVGSWGACLPSFLSILLSIIASKIPGRSRLTTERLYGCERGGNISSENVATLSVHVTNLVYMRSMRYLRARRKLESEPSKSHSFICGIIL